MWSVMWAQDTGLGDPSCGSCDGQELVIRTQRNQTRKQGSQIMQFAVEVK